MQKERVCKDLAWSLEDVLNVLTGMGNHEKKHFPSPVKPGAGFFKERLYPPWLAGRQGF